MHSWSTALMMLRTSKCGLIRNEPCVHKGMIFIYLPFNCVTSMDTSAIINLLLNYKYFLLNFHRKIIGCVFDQKQIIQNNMCREKEFPMCLFNENFPKSGVPYIYIKLISTAN